MCKSSYSTKYSLISRALDRGDKEAWKELISIYTPFFGHLLTHYSIPTSNHNDVMQEILIEISNSFTSLRLCQGVLSSSRMLNGCCKVKELRPPRWGTTFVCINLPALRSRCRLR